MLRRASVALSDVVVVSACRTAIGSFGGSLKGVQSYTLGATCMKEAIKRAGNFDPSILSDVRMGNCMEPIEAMNTARVAALLAKIPDTVPAVTINRVCTSAMEAVVSGALQIKTGYSDAVMVGGMESMSNAPYVVNDMRWGARMFDKPVTDGLIAGLHAGSFVITYPRDGPVEWARGKPYIMGLTAEFLVNKWKLTRAEQDEVALRSHNNAEKATTSGRFADEIVPVPLPPKKKDAAPGVFEKDEHFRPGLTAADLAKIDPFFIPKIGTVTAGNSSGINDGASVMILMSAQKAKDLGLKPIARLSGFGIGGCAPEIMGDSPIPAVHNMLAKNGGKPDWDLIECNEAFAAQYLAVEKGLGLKRDICNVNGGGIGLGHPVGSSGCRVIVSLIHEMQKRGAKKGMATLCGGGGVGYASEWELL